MLSTPIFIILFILIGAGLVLGAFYYFSPEKVVSRRIKKSYWETAKKDGDFRRWLELEVQTQVRRTRRLGMMIVVLETIWLIVVFGLWQKSRGL